MREAANKEPPPLLPATGKPAVCGAALRAQARYSIVIVAAAALLSTAVVATSTSTTVLPVECLPCEGCFFAWLEASLSLAIDTVELERLPLHSKLDAPAKNPARLISHSR